MKNIIVIVALTVILSGCGAVMTYDQMVNMNDMQASKTTYGHL